MTTSVSARDPRPPKPARRCSRAATPSRGPARSVHGARGKAVSSEVGTGSLSTKTRQNKKLEPPFRFDRNRIGPCVAVRKFSSLSQRARQENVQRPRDSAFAIRLRDASDRGALQGHQVACHFSVSFK